ncbi:MAG: TetR/AcrR family transcriptional regulator C-terminal domain-containing protein [Acidimicrobiia bacterium]|nr:TetR/AcrR family transcriptional regulator C-terminal domain-containing protein [Acidimicrobiia bacterium]
MTDPADNSSADVRRGGLTRGDIVESALAMVSDEGIAAVTMRRLADKIGVTPMALYHHVPNKGVLLDLVVEQVGADLRLAHDGRHWIEQIRSYALQWRDVLHSYPGVAGYLLRQEAPPAMAWRIIDDAVSLMVEAGFDERQATRAYAGLVSFVLARCDQEEVISKHAAAAEAKAEAKGAPAAGSADDDLTDDRIRARLTVAHSNVDLGRVASYLSELSADEHFTYMLDCMLAGIDAESHG